MCGRFRQTRSRKQLEDIFSGRFDEGGPDGESLEVAPHYNIAPSQEVVTVRQPLDQPVRRLSFMRWGLVPHWAKEIKVEYKNINARAETAATTPAFRDAFKSQRCLIPADGFYEWQKSESGKQPYMFEVGNGETFAFAGLWDKWPQPDGKSIPTCAILTTRPNSITAPVHDRMPVILNPEAYDLWLDPAFKNAEELTAMLQPYDSARMRCYPVSARVNDPKNDDLECARPFEVRTEAPQAGLF